MFYAHPAKSSIGCFIQWRRASPWYHFTVLTRLLNTNNNASDAGSPSGNNGISNHSKLVKQIQARILTGGPITVADYMREVLTNPSGGYYMSRDVFGSQGDFVTSPEISQMFGELIAVWYLNEWTKCGRPKPLQITELGPGRGTLMTDILRVFSKFKLLEPGDLSVSLVEVSPHLTRIQEEKICGRTTDPVKEKNREIVQPGAEHHYKESMSLQHGCRVRWYNRLTDVPRSFTLFLAHEFFDALPVHKLVKTEQGWREVLVDLDPTQPDRFRFVLSRERTPACLYRHEQESRNECEVSPQSLVIAQEMAVRIHENGGIGLIVDYGHEGDKTDTFRAFRNHKLHDPLIEPGTADLTADVDFAALKRAVYRPPKTEDEWKPLITYGTVNQADFLNKMGIQVRLEQLLNTVKGDAAAAQLKSAHQMLTDPDGMGGKFKVLALFPGVMEPILKRYPPHGFV